MNKVLLKAAVIFNIAAASLIYVACSGDDGEKGDPGKDGDGCLAAPVEASTQYPNGGYAITCGNTPYGVIQNGAPGSAVDKGDPGTPGKDGSSCTTTATATGALITCTDGTSVPIYNGTGGGGPGVPGNCTTEPVLLDNGDKVIQFFCGEGYAAAILICDKATGLYENSIGQVGFCTNEGIIERGTGGALRCGGQFFSPEKQFCQRVIDVGAVLGTTTVTAASNQLGWFAQVSENGTLSATAGGYPYGDVPGNGEQITSTTSAYNKAEGFPGVKSTLLPLCGADTTKPLTLPTYWWASRHSEQRVYNGKQYCARDLYIPSRLLSTGAFESGKLRINAAAPYTNVSGGSKEWIVKNNDLCFAGVWGGAGNITSPTASAATTTHKGYYLNSPYNGLDGSNQYSATQGAPCVASIGFLAETDPYTNCAEALSLDDAKCVARAQCLYNSISDNTCLVKDDLPTETVKKVGEPPRVIITGKYADASNTVIPAAISFKNPIIPTSANGTSNYNSIFTHDAGSGKQYWSKKCITQTREDLYYSVNDLRLVSKKIRDLLSANTGIGKEWASEALLDAAFFPSGRIAANSFSSVSGIATDVFGDPGPVLANDGTPTAVGKKDSLIWGPVCETYKTNPTTGVLEVDIARLALNDAVTCIPGYTLSINDPNHNGDSWEKPLRCVFGDGTSTIASPLRPKANCDIYGGTNSEWVADRETTVDEGANPNDLYTGACVRTGVSEADCPAAGYNGTGGKWFPDVPAIDTKCTINGARKDNTVMPILSPTNCSGLGGTYATGSATANESCTILKLVDKGACLAAGSQIQLTGNPTEALDTNGDPETDPDFAEDKTFTWYAGKAGVTRYCRI